MQTLCTRAQAGSLLNPIEIMIIRKPYQIKVWGDQKKFWVFLGTHIIYLNQKPVIILNKTYFVPFAK